MSKEIDGGTGCRRATVNVHDYATRVTLDVIGDGVYDISYSLITDLLIVHPTQLRSSTSSELWITNKTSYRKPSMI